MKKVLPNDRVSATSEISDTSADQLQYLCNVKRLSQWFYTGPRYLLSHNTTPANWSTMHESLADGFITKYADPLCLLGVGFGLVTAYIMFDIDRGSRNHPSNDPRAFERFLATLHKIGLTTPVIIQSSHSGGIHVYYFFDRDINTFRLASLSQVTLINAKFEIADGTLELFPNCKPHDNKSNHKLHRLPLQLNNGGAILDRQGNPLTCGVNLNHETQLHAYLQMAKNSARNNDIDKIEQQLDPVYAIFKSIPSRYQYIHNKGLSEKAKVWKIDLEVFMGIGWTDYHQTNGLIPRFVAYGIIFIGLEDKNDLFEWVLFAIKNTNGYTEYCRHQHNIEARIWDWIKLTVDKQFYVKYCGYPTRSRDRDNFIAKYKHSKSKATNKAEVYQRSRVDLVVSTITDVVETILATIADLPSRVEDVIDLIKSIALKKFGHAPSRNTLYKPHYKNLWVKLRPTNKLCDIVPITSNTFINIEYCPQTCTESAFEESVFGVTALDKKELKPIGGETSHSTLSVCSVNGLSEFPEPPPANEADPDLDPAHTSTSIGISYQTDPIEPESELDLSPDQTHLQSPLTPDSSDFDINPQLRQIEPATANLITALSHDRDKSIYSDPDLDSDLFLDRIDSQLVVTASLPNFDINPHLDLIEPPGVDLISQSTHDRDKLIEPDLITNPDPNDPTDRDKSPTNLNLTDWDKSIHSDPDYPSLKYFKKLPLEQKLKLTDHQLTEIRLSRFPPTKGSIVRPRDIYHVHGNDRGIINEIQNWGVYVSWSDGANGRYSLDELIQTTSN